MQKDQKTFYITTPIYYINAAPHIGSLYSTLLADIIARYKKISGYKTFFATGVDEHGQKVAEVAEKNNKTCQSFVDDLIPAFKNTWREWNIQYDFFVRTTDESHKKAVQKWIIELQKKGIIYKSSYQGWYSVSSEAFLTEKDIELKDSDGTPLCPISGKRAVWLVEQAYFFRLSAYETQLLEFYEKNPDFITPYERAQEVISFVKQGLKDLCISRSKKTLSWGIPFPGDDEYVVYVWADALNNYLTAVGYLQDNKKELFDTFWPCNVHVLGKDIVRFHAVFWLAFLMASELPLPKRLLVHGWILVDNQKMSKSLGNTVEPAYLKEKYGIDRCRYYFARHMGISHDSSFSYDDLEEKTNAELSNSFGNLVQRVLTMAHSYGFNELKGPYSWQESEIALQKAAHVMIKKVENEMESYMIHRAYAHVNEYVNMLNAYVQHHQPWVLIKENKERVRILLAALLHGIYTAAVLFWPIMPETMETLFAMLGLKNNAILVSDFFHQWNMSFSLTKPEPLFVRYESKKESEKMIQEDIKKVEESSFVTFEEFAKVELRVGEIIAVEDIPKAEKLYKLTVDFGQYGKRTICAGIKEYYAPVELIGIKTAFAFNLAPRMLRGIESCGMTMMAKNSDNVPTIVKIDQSVENGTRLQ